MARGLADARRRRLIPRKLFLFKGGASVDKLRAMHFVARPAETGSFAAAAKSLDVSTPAVSQLVDALERSLGVRLFHRTSQGLSLTPDGERYYEASRRIAADVDELERG